MGKLTEKEKEQWKELFNYIEKELFNYDDNQKLQKNAVLRLRGLASGQLIANNHNEKNGSYSPEVLLTAFKMNKLKIKNAIQDKDFESEEHKMAYCIAIIRDKLNSVYEHLQRRNQNTVDNIDTSIIEYEGMEYQKDTNKKSTRKFEDMW